MVDYVLYHLSTEFEFAVLSFASSSDDNFGFTDTYETSLTSTGDSLFTCRSIGFEKSW